jgi:hypothetical protein
MVTIQFTLTQDGTACYGFWKDGKWIERGCGSNYELIEEFFKKDLQQFKDEIE